MTSDQQREVEDAVEQLVLQLSNLFDDIELVSQARMIYHVLYPSGRVELGQPGSLSHNLECVSDLIDRVREWADMTESALSDVNDVLVDVEV